MRNFRANWTPFFAGICVMTSSLLISGRPESLPKPNDAQPSQNKSDSTGLVLPTPYGKHTDDLEGMLKRRNIRALVMINPIGFFYVKGQPMGAVYEAMREFQTYVNTKWKTGALKVEVTFIPVRPDQAEAAVTQGIGDLIANAVVITSERKERVAFTTPIQKDVKQILVAGENFGTVSRLEELGSKQVYVNPLSVNYQKLQQINDNFKKAGKPPILLKAADKNLLDDDLVQMVNAGLLPAAVTTEERAKLWSQVLPHVTIHPDVVIASGEQTAWVVRKNNPRFKQLLD